MKPQRPTPGYKSPKAPTKFRLGLCLRETDHHMLYALRGGFGYRWMPHLIQHVIASAWNAVACRITGHGVVWEGKCTDCCRKVKREWMA